MHNKQASEAVSRARTALVLDHPFFGVLSLRLALIQDPSCDTMWTDGITLGYNPNFVLSVTPAELKGVLAHEILHCSNGHPWRRGGRDKDKWNYACDLAINPIVLDAKMVLPEGVLNGTHYRGLSAEEIYARIPDSTEGGGDGESEAGGQPGSKESPGQNDNQHGDGQGEQDRTPGKQPGEVRDAPDPDRTDELASQWKMSTLQAAQAAKAMGKLPAGLDRLIKEIKHPPADWRSKLRRFVQEQSKNDYSWKFPNQRYLHSGLFLPALRSETMPEIVVAVDTSGSIDDMTLAAFSAEINGIACDVMPEAVHVVYCDATVQEACRFEQGDLIVLEPKGGGGTDFRPVFDWIEQQEISPACLIYLTDLYGHFPDEIPAYPVLWGAITDGQAPWGEIVKISI